MNKITYFLAIVMILGVTFSVQAVNTSTCVLIRNINGDNNVTSADVTALYNYLLYGDESAIVNGDVNGDGSINACDVTAIYNILLSNETPDEHEYVDLGLPSGTLWATTNVGSDTPEGYGYYFAWGETTPKDQYLWSNYKWCVINTNHTLYQTKYCTNGDYGFYDNKTELDYEDDAASMNWGPAWQMPSIDQLGELSVFCECQKTVINGITGDLITGVNGNSIFLPRAGCYEGGFNDPYDVGTMGFYWSRDLYTTVPNCAKYFHIGIFDCCAHQVRKSGFSVRPVRVSSN